ncbi:MAG: hypothetical protein M3384_21180 [Acidobacteriota bacterium]|nr:hypothetical protein [Acidobacteriota bacterium]
MNGFDSETMLLNLAAGLEDDPAFMSHVLARYCRMERMDKDALTGELGIPLFLFARLALCKRPEADSPDFINEIGEIADYVPVDETKLVRIIRQVDSLSAFSSAPSDSETEEIPASNPFSVGTLAAARDRDEDEDSDENTKDDDRR